MLPKIHIALGIIFSAIFLFFGTPVFYIIVMFLASVLIDTDHYIWYVKREHDWNLRNAYIWHKTQPLMHKPVMHIFHTVEFILIIIILSFYSQFFLFLSIGLLLHSVMDIIDMFPKRRYSCRELSLIRYLIRKNNKEIYL